MAHKVGFPMNGYFQSNPSIVKVKGIEHLTLVALLVLLFIFKFPNILNISNFLSISLFEIRISDLSDKLIKKNEEEENGK